MSLRDNIANISQNVFFNQNQLEENILYNGNTISAVVHQYEELNDAIVDQPFNAGLAIVYAFDISDSDVPYPKYRDVIVYESKTFEVQQFEHGIGVWNVQATADERRFA